MMTKPLKLIAALLPAFLALSAEAQYRAEFIENSKAWGSVVADFNRDGHDDIYITGHDEDDRIWYWSPAGYVPSAQVFEWVDRHDCDAADFNRDGYLDIFCAVGADRGTGTGPKELWLQDASGWFTKVANHGAEDPYGRGRIPVFFDFNHDGYPDIYLANEATLRTDGRPNINHVFVNQAGTGFTEAVTLATGPRGFQCVAKGDMNGDGWDDLVVCDGANPARAYINNRAGDFEELVAPVMGSPWRDAKLADMNGDGRTDLVVVTGFNQFQIWLNSGSAPYFAAPAFQTELAVTAKSLTVGDFDRDGIKDVYVVLMKADCLNAAVDSAPDLVFRGQPGTTWVRTPLPQAGYQGCGHLADTVDGSKVMLMNGGVSWRGPNYVLTMGR